MNAADKSLQIDAYRCPGQRHSISRAVHLGRLAAFYPACRQCPHRDDTGTLSVRQVEQFEEVRASREPQPLFHDEGAAGVYLNEITPAMARDIAAAFGDVVRGEGAANPEIPKSPNPLFNPQSLIPNPFVLLVGDGRAITAEVSVAVGEGLRSMGCDVVDIGPATAACLGFAVRRFEAAGGVLVGNPGRQPQVVGLQFWDAEARPLSAGGSLEPIAERYRAGVSHPEITYGTLHRLQADAPYLAVMAEHYHALRPLRVVVDSASAPLVEYLQRLAATVACQVIPSQSEQHELPEQARANAAHFAACIDGDGETCHVLDEQGRAVETDRLLLLLVRHVLLPSPIGRGAGGEGLLLMGRPHPNPLPKGEGTVTQHQTVVLEASTPKAVVRRIEQLGVRVVDGGGRRADLAAAMRQSGAALGGGPSGRFWHCTAGVPLPDALMTVTRLLAVLSRSDEPFSAVLDRNANLG